MKKQNEKEQKYVKKDIQSYSENKKSVDLNKKLSTKLYSLAQRKSWFVDLANDLSISPKILATLLGSILLFTIILITLALTNNDTNSNKPINITSSNVEQYKIKVNREISPDKEVLKVYSKNNNDVEVEHILTSPVSKNQKVPSENINKIQDTSNAPLEIAKNSSTTNKPLEPTKNNNVANKSPKITNKPLEPTKNNNVANKSPEITNKPLKSVKNNNVTNKPLEPITNKSLKPVKNSNAIVNKDLKNHTTNNNWELQLVASQSTEQAEKYWNKISKLAPEYFNNKEPVYRKITINNTTIIRLRLTGFKSLQEVKEMCTQLKAKKIDCSPAK